MGCHLRLTSKARNSDAALLEGARSSPRAETAAFTCLGALNVHMDLPYIHFLWCADNYQVPPLPS